MLSKDHSFTGRVCGYFTASFALWTISANLTTFAGGGLISLIVTFLLISAAVILSVQLLRGRMAPVAARGDLPAGDRAEEPPLYRGSVDMAVRTERGLFWLVVILAAGLTLVAHRPDADDSTYVNYAVHAVDNPRSPIYSGDTRHLTDEKPVQNSFYKLHSFEMVPAALSLITGIPAIYFFHLLIPALAAILAVFAYGELCKIIAPRHWIFALLAVFVFLCANGDVHASFGNMSFVRLHQGKAIFLTAVVPLVLVYGLRFASDPGPRRWILLCGAQIAGVGMTATALWVVPVVAFLAVLTGAAEKGILHRAKSLALGIVSSAYVVLAGLYLKFAYPMPSRLVTTDLGSFQLYGNSVKYVFGFTPFAAACLFIVLAAWAFADNRVARRFGLVFPVFAFLSLANPLAAALVATRITGVLTHWRVFWLLPLPALAAIVLISPLSLEKPHAGPWTRRSVYALFLFVTLAVLPQRTIFSQANHTRIRVPGLKVDLEYDVARQLNEMTSDRPNVVAPEEVSLWLPTFHRHDYPLLARARDARMFPRDGQYRLGIKYYVSGFWRPDNPGSFLQAGLRRYRVKAVCVPLKNKWTVEIRSALEGAGFSKVGRLRGYELWRHG